MSNSVGSPRLLLVFAVAALVMMGAEGAVLNQISIVEPVAAHGQSAAATQLGLLGGGLMAVLTGAAACRVLQTFSLPRRVGGKIAAMARATVEQA